jgi:hypothetical protein
VAEPAIPHQVDDDVVVEARPEGHREPNGGDRGLRIVCVHVDDRDVEALREVARVARRAPFLRARGETDLVVRDQMERPAGRVAVQRLQVERLGDDALRREGRVAVDQDGERGAPVVRAGRVLVVRLHRARVPCDDGVDVLQVARVRLEHELDLAALRPANPLGAQVVLDVAGPGLWVGRDRFEHALALELPQNRVVRAADDVRQDVQPAAVRHPHHDRARPLVAGELDRLVEHRNHYVEALDGELLLPEKRAAEVALEPLHLGETAKKGLLLVGREGPPVRARLDRLPEPDALLVARDVLDLVRHRPAVRLAEKRKRLGKRLARDVDAEEPRRDLALQLARQLRFQAFGVESRVARGVVAKGVEARGEVAVRPVRLDERHRRRDRAEENGRRSFPGDRLAVAVDHRGIELAEALDERMALEDLRVG